LKKQSDFYKLIEQLCFEKKIKMRQASFGYITELEKNGKIRHIVGESLELNSASSYKIASDKFATYAVIIQNNIPIIKHNMIFNPETRIDYEDNDIMKAMIWFEDYGEKAILKANNSSEGKDVYLVKDKNELKNKIIECFMNHKDSVSICPFYKISYEYRVIILDGEVLLCYKKEKPSIMGDGKSTVIELIEKEKISNYYDNLNFEYIPKINEKIEVFWKHNLSQGAKPNLEIDIDKKERICDIAIRARKGDRNQICKY